MYFLRLKVVGTVQLIAITMVPVPFTQIRYGHHCDCIFFLLFFGCKLAVMLVGWPEDELHFNLWAGPRLAPIMQRSQQSQSSSHTRQDGSRRGQHSGRIHNLDSPVLITVIFSLLTRAGHYNSVAYVRGKVIPLEGNRQDQAYLLV